MGPLFRFFHRIVSRGPETVLEKTLFPVLVVCAWIYGCGGLLRSLLYRLGLFHCFQAPVPVISVGNLSAGGTGKTPVVDYLSKYLLSKGKKTAVVSRGYGRKDISQLQVVSTGDGPLIPPALAGDEPFLLARRNPSLTVIVAAERKNGVAKAVREHGAEVILLDDGFQHLAVKRDLDIVLLDADNPLGNGKVLPAGPLREFPGALKRGNIFILTRAEKSPHVRVDLPGEVLSCRHEVSSHAVSLDGERVEIDSLFGRRGGAFAGLAAPEKFFADLKKIGLNIEKTAVFQDHANYGKIEKLRLDELGRDLDYLITTEKDAVKLRQEDLPIICFAVPLSLEFSEPGKLETMLDGLF